MSIGDGRQVGDSQRVEYIHKILTIVSQPNQIAVLMACHNRRAQGIAVVLPAYHVLAAWQSLVATAFCL